jgi:predicted dehydrogenase
VGLVRIGVLGAARITPKAVVAPARTNGEAEVVAVAARDPARAADFAQQHDIPRVHRDYATLLADDDIDAVYNPLPNGLHGQWTIAALEAGKHVLCEKPFTANGDEAMEVAEVADRTGRVAMEAFHYRYHPFFTRVLELADTLGPLHEVAARMIAVLPDRSDVRYQLDLAGGAGMDVGCYAVHQLRTVAGAEPSVTDASAKLLTPGIDRAMRARFSWPGGASGSIDCALLEARAPVADLRVSGERGSLRASFPTRPQIGWITSRVDGSRRRERVPGDTTFTYQLRAFCDAVLHGAATLTPAADSVATMRLIDAMYTAAGLEPRRPTCSAGTR